MPALITAYPISYSVIATCSILMAVIILFVRFPKGERWRTARAAKYMVFASFVLYGLPGFAGGGAAGGPVVSMSFNYLSDSVTYLLMMAVCLLLIRTSVKGVRMAYFIGPMVLLWSASFALFVFSHPVYGLDFPAIKWSFFATDVLVLAYLAGALYGFVRGRIKGEKDVVKMYVFYNLYLAVFMFYQIFLPVFPGLMSVIAFVNIVFILILLCFTLWFFHYASGAAFEQRLGAGGGREVREVRETAEQGSPLTEEEEARLKENIDRWLEQKRFLEQDDGMEKLAADLDTDLKSLRYYFRTRVHSDFRTWRISLRIQFAKDMLAENPDVPINHLSKMAGFTTKSNFYLYFKQATGMTPAEYRDKLVGGGLK